MLGARSSSYAQKHAWFPLSFRLNACFAPAYLYVLLQVQSQAVA